MTISEVVASGDLDALVRLVDGLCSSRDWDGVVELRDRCRFAIERGLQLWPAAEYAEYRLALDAPGSHAGPVVTETAGRFALGPLWEVAASTHSWDELEPHLPSGPARTMAAHERVLRGDVVSPDDIDGGILELPLHIEDWEPTYPVAVYRSSEADFPAPDPGRFVANDTTPADVVVDPEANEALRALVRSWVEQSNGTVEVVAVEGDALGAIGALGHERFGSAQVTGSTAMAWMAWAAADGGAYGRRRGAPAGRFSAWWAAAALADLEWPPAPADLGDAVSELEWWLWEPEGTTSGWQLHLAVSDPAHGLGWAVSATDQRREEDVEDS